MSYDNHPTPEEIERYIARAHEMRADALRGSFKSFIAALVAIPTYVANLVRIPETDRL